jgi:hypothetical protein
LNAEEYWMASRVDITTKEDQLTFRRLKDLFVYLDEKWPSEVRVAFLQTFPRILRHINIPNEDLMKMLETVLSYSKDSDPAIRAAIPEGTNNVIGSMTLTL